MHLVIVQPALPHYRVPVFARIAEKDLISLSVWFGTEVHGTHGFVDDPGSLSFNARRFETRKLGPFLFNPAHLKAMAQGGADVVILPWDVRYVSLPMAVAVRRSGTPKLLLWGHGTGRNDRRGVERLRRGLAESSDGVILYSDEGAKDWRRRGLPSEKVHVARNAIDQQPITDARRAWSRDALDRFMKDHEIDDRPVVLFCSRLTPGKGLQLLIEAFAMVVRRMPEATLVLIGDGPMRELVVRLVAEKKIVRNVRLVGALYEEHDLAPWFLSSTVFAFARRIGLSILHAFGYGLPVVTSDDVRHRNPEFSALRPGVNGLLFPGDDAEEFADRLSTILSDDVLRAQMTRAARETVSAGEYSIDCMVSGIVDAVYATLSVQ